VPNSQPFRHLLSRKFALAVSLAMLAAALIAFSAVRAGAQETARVTAVDPATGKSNDTITVSGENLGKAHVAAVFLSDDKDDFKAVIVSQEASKIVIKVPAVKPGSYNVSIQAANAILIQPIKFTVE
jgi:hypothetical protein